MVFKLILVLAVLIAVAVLFAQHRFPLLTGPPIPARTAPLKSGKGLEFTDIAAFRAHLGADIGDLGADHGHHFPGGEMRQFGFEPEDRVLDPSRLLGLGAASIGI